MSDGNGLKYTATVDKRFKAPGPQPNGLQAADDGLWVIDQTNLKVYQLDWDSGAVLHEFQTATEHSSGITLDGDGNVWIASTFQFEVVKYDPNTGEELARFPDPGTGYNVFSSGIKSSSHGVEWRDGKIYLSAAADPAPARDGRHDLGTDPRPQAAGRSPARRRVGQGGPPVGRRHHPPAP